MKRSTPLPGWRSLLAIFVTSIQSVCIAQTSPPKPETSEVHSDSKSTAENELDRGPIEKSNAMLGAKLVTKAGEELATVTDLLLDLQRGTAVAVIVERNQSHKKVAMPFPLLRRSEAGRYECRFSAEEFSRLPDLGTTGWEKTVTRQWAAELYQQLETRVIAAKNLPPTTLLTRATQLKGLKIRNLKGTQLGQLDGFAIAIQDAQLVYAAVSQTEKQPGLQAIPLPAFIVKPDSPDWLLDITPDALVQRPLFTDPAWPQTIDRGWAEYIHVLYGTSVFEGVRSEPKATDQKSAKP